MICPIMSFQRDLYTEISCRGRDCAWADEKGKCLIAKKLELEVAALGQKIPTPAQPQTRPPIEYFPWGGQ